MKRGFAALLLIGFAATGAVRAEQAGGLNWKAPHDWTAQGERPMRVATYQIPPAKGDKEPGELAVFYFGQGNGGGVDANAARWVGQFQKADGSAIGKDATIKKETMAGFKTTTVDVKGTYVGGGPMMGPSTPKPGFRLLGAIVEAPGGEVFFKLTGPEKTVLAAERPFHKLLEGMKKQ